MIEPKRPKFDSILILIAENIIWDENIVPNEYYSGEGCLSLPKLNLQFLTLHDYLLRNCNLFRLESTFEIRQDIEDAVSRMLPWKDEEGGVVFGGWARMVKSHIPYKMNDIEVKTTFSFANRLPF